jgi:hypothetical protein
MGDAHSGPRCTISSPSGVRVWLATGHTDMRKSVPSSVKGGVGRRDALLGPTAAKSIALTSRSTAHFSPVDSQESQVGILTANIQSRVRLNEEHSTFPRC